MFKFVNTFQVVVLVLILVGVVLIFMRQNNTCVMKQNKVKEGFNITNFTQYPNTNLYANVIARYDINDRAAALNECNDRLDCIGVVENPQHRKCFLLGNRLNRKVSARGTTSWIKNKDINYSGNNLYPGMSRDNYLNFCENGRNIGMCEFDSFQQACRNECPRSSNIS